MNNICKHVCACIHEEKQLCTHKWGCKYSIHAEEALYWDSAPCLRGKRVRPLRQSSHSLNLASLVSLTCKPTTPEDAHTHAWKRGTGGGERGSHRVASSLLGQATALAENKCSASQTMHLISGQKEAEYLQTWQSKVTSPPRQNNNNHRMLLKGK